MHGTLCVFGLGFAFALASPLPMSFSFGNPTLSGHLGFFDFLWKNPLGWLQVWVLVLPSALPWLLQHFAVASSSSPACATVPLGFVLAFACVCNAVLIDSSFLVFLHFQQTWSSVYWKANPNIWRETFVWNLWFCQCVSASVLLSLVVSTTMCIVSTLMAANQEGFNWERTQCDQQRCGGLHKYMRWCGALTSFAVSDWLHGSSLRRNLLATMLSKTLPNGALPRKLLLSQHRPEIVNPIHLGDVWAPSADWQGMHQDEAFPEKSALSYSTETSAEKDSSNQVMIRFSHLSCQLMRLW